MIIKSTARQPGGLPQRALRRGALAATAIAVSAAGLAFGAAAPAFAGAAQPGPPQGISESGIPSTAPASTVDLALDFTHPDEASDMVITAANGTTFTAVSSRRCTINDAGTEIICTRVYQASPDKPLNVDDHVPANAQPGEELQVGTATIWPAGQNPDEATSTPLYVDVSAPGSPAVPIAVPGAAAAFISAGLVGWWLLRRRRQ